jgi:hypothetical protein
MNDEVKVSGMSLFRLAIVAVVIAGIAAIVMIILPQIGITVPAFIIKILWIIFVVVIGVVAIKFVWSLL